MVVVGGRAPPEPLGQRQPPGARPAADRRVGHQAGPHDPHRRRRPLRHGRGVPRRAAARTAGRRSSTSRWTSSSTPRRPGAAPPERQRIEPDGDALTTIAGLLAEARQPVLILGTDVWADGAEEAALRFVQDLGIPTLTNGMGRGLRARRPPAAGDQGAERRARRCRPGGRGRDTARLPARLRRLRRQGGRLDPRAGRARRGLPRPGGDARRARGLGVGRPDRGLRRPAGRAWSAAPSRTGRRGVHARRTRSPRPPRATPSCSAPRPTRSTRRGSTASWCRGSPTTRW